MASYPEPVRPYFTADFHHSEIFPGRLWLGEAPRDKDLAHLRTLGVTDIVDLTGAEDVLTREREAAFNVHHFPFPDGFFTSLHDERVLSRRMMTGAANQLQELLTSGAPTYLHCIAGISRSPTVYILWMLQFGHAQTFQEALNRATRARSVISPNPDLVEIVRDLHPRAFPPR